MSDLNSWEDSPDAQDENLSRQTQQRLHMGAANNNFQPAANSFQPGAQSFQPGGYQQYQGYGGYGQQYGAGGFQQYGQQQQYGQFQQSYGQYQQQPQPQQQQQQQQQQQGYNQYSQQYNNNQYGGYGQQQSQQSSNQRVTPTIAKRGDSIAQSTTNPSPVVAATSTKPKTLSLSAEDTKTPKTLSISAADTGAAAPKVEKSGGTKIMSIGVSQTSSSTSSPKPDADKTSTSAAAPVKKNDKAGDASTEANKAATSTVSDAAAATSSPIITAEARAEARKADAVLEEQAADVDEELLREMYGKEHVNVIVLGHVDAGKSTLGGSILYATGMVDERTMDKLKRDAKEAGRETWYLSWALDLTKEERAQGKTVEVGRGFFETEKRRYSILDAPGHKTFVPSMIGGASQADVGILVISARKGEYETGFEKGGQTREHAVLAKTQGVNKLIVVVNKMDDPTVEWSEERYKECIVKLTVFLKGVGYNPKTDLTFMPVSAQATIGIKDPVPKSIAPWNDAPSLLGYLDSMQALERKVNAPLMMPVAAKYRDLGTMIEGKIDSGILKKDQKYLLMPSRAEISILSLYGETEDEIPVATCGDQVRLKIKGAEEEDILPGFVLCNPKRPVHCVSAFEAQIVLLDLRSILSAGFNCVMHVHSATEEVTFTALLHKLEKGTNRKSKKPPGFATKGMSIIARLEVSAGAGSVCIETFADYPQLGRFTLRDQGQTIAIGKVTKLITDRTDESSTATPA